MTHDEQRVTIARWIIAVWIVLAMGVGALWLQTFIHDGLTLLDAGQEPHRYVLQLYEGVLIASGQPWKPDMAGRSLRIQSRIIVIPLWIIFLAVLTPGVWWAIRYRQLNALHSWLCAGLFLLLSATFLAYAVWLWRPNHPNRGALLMAVGSGIWMGYKGITEIVIDARQYADQWRKRLGLCNKCGYDLRATPSRCPECGTVPEK
jgi:hypothetical protein